MSPRRSAIEGRRHAIERRPWTRYAAGLVTIQTDASAIIWINGAFGAGKTGVARYLVKRSHGGWLFDPERIGFMIRRLLPWTRAMDFQALPLWRTLCVEALAEAVRARPERVAIVPMAIVEPAIFDEIMVALRERGIAVHHFSLLASPDTLARRIRRQLDWPASRRWRFANIERCAVLRRPEYATHVETDGRTIAAIAAEILGHLPAEVRARLG